MRVKLLNINSELISQTDSSIVHEKDAQQNASQSWLGQLGQVLRSMFFVRDEPKLRQSIDRDGNQIWQIFDPTTNQTIWLDSETAVRIWLDRRFNS
jgi:hypothetical protein